jgi:hypothetical protein
VKYLQVRFLYLFSFHWYFRLNYFWIFSENQQLSSPSAIDIRKYGDKSSQHIIRIKISKMSMTAKLGRCQLGFMENGIMI